MSQATEDPFIPYTTSNDPLPDALYPVLNSRLSHYSRSIADIDAKVEQLLSERAILAEAHRTHMATKSPLRRMPSELLGEIFTHSLGRWLFRSTQRGFFRSLAAVCRMWRETAKTTPRLCRGLVLHIDNIPLERAAGYFQGLRMWLDLLGKSGGLVLAFERHGDETPHLDQILSMLTTALDLSIFKEFIIPTYPFLSSFLACQSGAHNQVSSLTLGDFWHRRKFIMEGGVLADFETTFPFLDTLCLQAETRSPSHSSIRSLVLGSWQGVLAGHEVRLCLTGLPRLETLVITHVEAGSETPGASDAILTHTALKKVMVSGERLLEGFKWVALPSLEAFFLRSWAAALSDDVIRSANILRRILMTSNSPHMDLSLGEYGGDGRITTVFLNKIIEFLPPQCRLHLGFSGMRHSGRLWFPDDYHRDAGHLIWPIVA
jgi:hypothetical protein